MDATPFTLQFRYFTGKVDQCPPAQAKDNLMDMTEDLATLIAAYSGPKVADAWELYVMIVHILGAHVAERQKTIAEHFAGEQAREELINIMKGRST